MKFKNLQKMAGVFEEVGYFLRDAEAIALRGVMARGHGMTLLLEGLPGVGKTFLAESSAKVIEANYLYYLCHSWTDDQELFAGIDVPAVVSGDTDNVRQLGILAQAALSSQKGMTVLCLDELDKTSDKVESLLLDFLQSGKVPVKPGEFLQANLENLLVFITSNNLRELTDPLLRRVRRVKMEPLPVMVVDSILSDRCSLPVGLVKVTRKIAFGLAEAEGYQVSVQEMTNLLEEIKIATSKQEVAISVSGWSTRHNTPIAVGVIGPIWAELTKWQTS